MEVSIVSAGRDPHHAGNLMERVKIAFRRNIENAKQYNVDVEWIFVEWNPTKELVSPTLASTGVKCYIASNKLHTRLVHPDLVDQYTFMDGFANNLGARKATNEWVIITNNDTILSPEIWEFIRQGKVDPKVMYRAERRDIPFADFDRSFEHMEKYKSKVYGTINKPRHAAGSFMLASMQEYPGYDERITDTNRHIDGHLCWNWENHLGNQLQSIGKIYKAEHKLLLTKQRKKEFIPYKGYKHSKLGIIYNEPYDNTPDWGLPLEPVEEIGENTWRVG